MFTHLANCACVSFNSISRGPAAHHSEWCVMVNVILNGCNNHTCMYRIKWDRLSLITQLTMMGRKRQPLKCRHPVDSHIIFPWVKQFYFSLSLSSIVSVFLFRFQMCYYYSKRIKFESITCNLFASVCLIQLLAIVVIKCSFVGNWLALTGDFDSKAFSNSLQNKMKWFVY